MTLVAETSMEAFTTLPTMLRHVMSHYRNSYAFNYKQDGVWQHLSTEQFFATVRRLSLGLRSLGIKKGDTVGVLAHSSPMWLMIDLAVMVAGGISVPIFPQISEDNFEVQVTNSKMQCLVIIGQEQWRIFKRTQEYIKNVITWNVKTEGRGVYDIEEVMTLGDGLSQQKPELYTEMQDSVQPTDIATIIYTSGSTGVPKGVEITHRNLISQLKASKLRFPISPGEDRALSALPLAHVFERMVVYYYVSAGISIYFADDIRKVGDLYPEIQPTMTTMVPRLLEKIAGKIENKIDSLKGVKRRIAKWGLRYARNESIKNERVRSFLRPLVDRLVLSKIREALGGRLHSVIVGGAPLDPNLCRFFLNAGVPIYQGYGLTESSPVICVNYEGRNKPGTVGPPFPGVDVRLTEIGEIVARGPNIMKGYHSDPVRTREVIDQEGWLHTGDCGELDDDGFLTVTGRIKDILKTSGGKIVTPVPIEQQLCRHPLIDMVMVVAEGKKYTSALLFPDFDLVIDQKKKQKMTHLSHEAFLASDAVQQDIQAHIDRVNQNLNKWEQIQKFRFVSHPISILGGELTPTLKIRRQAIAKKYQDLIEAMYREPENKE